MSKMFKAACIVVIMMSLSSPVEAEDVTIGLLTPLVGPYSLDGKHQRNFAELAAEEINAGGGVMGRPVKIIVEDTQLKPGVGSEKAKMLIQKGVKYLTGGVSSNVVGVVSKIAHESDVLHFGIGGSNSLTGENCNQHHFNLDPAAYQMATGTGSYVIDKLGLPKEWFCITVDYSWGHTCLDSVKKMLAERGGKLVGNVMTPIREKDFSTVLIKAVTSKAPVLGVIVYGLAQGKLLQQAYEFGIGKRMKIVVVATSLSIAATPEALNGVYVGLPWYWNIQDPITRNVAQKYIDKYGQPPAWTGTLVYDSIKVMATAMEKAKSFDVSKLIPVLEGLEFQTSKGMEKIRACDHRVIQDWYVGVGKSPDKMKSKWDLIEILGHAGGEEIMLSCQETGCKME